MRSLEPRRREGAPIGTHVRESLRFVTGGTNPSPFGPNGPAPSCRGGGAALESAPAEVRHLVVHRLKGSHFEWIDICGVVGCPRDVYSDLMRQEMSKLEFPEFVSELLNEQVVLPQCLIQHDAVNRFACLVIRYATPDAPTCSNSMQDLTNRLTIVVEKNRIVTLHRLESPVISQMRRNFQNKYLDTTMERIVNTLVSRSSRSFMNELRMDLERFDILEGRLLSRSDSRTLLSEEIYHIKRRSSAFSHVLGMMSHAHKQLMTTHFGASPNCPHVSAVSQSCMHVKLLSDEIDNNARAALDLLFQISNFELNSLIRVLTLFSAFFAPLGLITGFYGMNVKNLPFADDEYAIAYVLASMVLSAFTIQLWYRYKAF